MQQVLHQPVQPPSTSNGMVPGRMDEIVLHALERDPGRRFPSARELAIELEAVTGAAGAATVAEWVERTSGERLASLSRLLDDTRRCLRQAQLTVAAEPPMDNNAATMSAAAVAASVSELRTRGRTTRRVFMSVVGVALFAFVLGMSFRDRWLGASSTTADTPPIPAAAKPLPVTPEQSPLVAAPAAEASRPPEADRDLETKPVRRSSARTSRRAGKARPHPGTRPRVGAKGAPRPDCDPPTYLDPDGIRIYKDECL